MKNIKLLLLLCFLGYQLSAQVSTADIEASARIIGLNFEPAERDSMRDNLKNTREDYARIHAHYLDNAVPPALNYHPVPLGFEWGEQQSAVVWQLPEDVRVPANRQLLAFYSVAELSSMLRSRRLTSVELTRLYLERLKKYGDTLHCVVSITEELALQQARKADMELSAGFWRGPLHGIPYGVKDLLAVEGYKTTWGAGPFKDQIRAETATVVQKLEKAGAVLVAKLSMGALAWGDVWFEGKTRNPWNLEMGSSGSSAGSASATAAGLVGFSIGTETWGSIVSPATRCGVSGLRPTYGRVSRAGAMALSWSMDKIGPICRTAEDCAMVFEVIRGTDGLDQTVIDAPFNYYSEVDLSQLKIGYFKSYFDQAGNGQAYNRKVLEVLEELGANLEPVELKTELPVRSLGIILSAEAAAAFDELTRSNADELLVRQIKNAWPNVFRAARFIPAVEYINANRIRYQLLQEMHALMKNYDVIVTPSFAGDQLLITNLTGHPCVVVPSHKGEDGRHSSISFLGNLFDEATILTVAKAYQEATGFEEMHPPGYW
jgi:Asp-tRNA(Asn)/Glu-tRNA(Gln) amidotransferase A subunit family amidase